MAVLPRIFQGRARSRTACQGSAIALLCLSSALSGQATDPKISSAPGGVPVPNVPATPAPTTVPVDASPLSHVFRVRLVDGRNGVPVDRAHLRLWYDETGSAAFSLVTNAQGVAIMPAPIGAPVRVLVAPDDTVDCRKAQSASTAPLAGFNLAALAEAGAAGANHCGRIGEKPRPGELVLFVRPLRWYEGLNRP